MLNARENLEAVITNGKPDRYSNNYEGLIIMMNPYYLPNHSPLCTPGEPPIKDEWGISWVFPAGQLGQWPIHDEEHTVIKDFANWKEYVKAPKADYSEADWDVFREDYRNFDRSKALLATFYNPGLLEMTHHLGSIDEALMACLSDTDEMVELVKYIKEFELKQAEGICANLKPDVIFHHDDWGSESNSFLSPALFDEIFLEPYKEIYTYYKEHGVKYVFHHSDSYAANIVPEMIEMGIDVWQGPMASNNVPELIKKYGDKITFMGNIDNKFIDFDGWTPEDVKKAAYDATIGADLGPEHYIPCITQGGPGSTYSGTYLELCHQIDLINSEKFGFSVEEIEEARLPLQVIFG